MKNGLGRIEGQTFKEIQALKDTNGRLTRMNLRLKLILLSLLQYR